MPEETKCPNMNSPQSQAEAMANQIAWEIVQRDFRPESAMDGLIRVTAGELSGLEESISTALSKLIAENEKLKKMGEKVNEIRNSIVGFQSFNFSEHAYPLVAALNEAGFVGMEYPEAEEYFGTMLERTKRAESQLTATEAKLNRAIELSAPEVSFLLGCVDAMNRKYSMRGESRNFYYEEQSEGIEHKLKVFLSTLTAEKKEEAK